jgi:hypothetical protein
MSVLMEGVVFGESPRWHDGPGRVGGALGLPHRELAGAAGARR